MGIDSKYGVSEAQRALLDEDLRLVMEANKVTNLTRIVDWEQGQLLHVEDSLVGLEELRKAPQGRYADLGTGGGFPGIPMAIMTGRETLLVDSVGKKTKALDGIIERLGLARTTSTFTGRAEELALKEPEAFSVISARALSSLPSLLELAAPLLRMGGWLVCYKAQPEQTELDQAASIEGILGMKLVSTRETMLSDGETKRVIFVFEKVSKPAVKLPRRPGMAQKRPYK